MFSVLCVIALSFVTNSEGPSEVQPAQQQTYATAYEKSLSEGKPLVVLVSAQWCPACDVLKDTTLKSLEQSGELADVSVAVVDRDAEPELAQQLMEGEKKVPQIIVYSQNTTGRWQRKKLTGYQPTQPVRSLIRSALGLRRG
jgi:thioredoxin-like negative regulator of GroEL